MKIRTDSLIKMAEKSLNHDNDITVSIVFIVIIFTLLLLLIFKWI